MSPNLITSLKRMKAFLTRRHTRHKGRSLDDLPSELLLHILVRCDISTVRNARLVNQRINKIIDVDLFWIKYYRYRCIYIPPKHIRELHKTTAYYLDYDGVQRLNLFNRNILPPITDGLERKLEAYTDAYEQLTVHVDGKNLAGFPSPDDEEYIQLEQHVRPMMKSITHRRLNIRFSDFGIPDQVMDHLRPQIVISEWVGSADQLEYMMRSFLLYDDQPESGETLATRQLGLGGTKVALLDFEEKLSNVRWQECQMSHHDYPIGVRGLCLISGIYTRTKDLAPGDSIGRAMRYQVDHKALIARLQVRLEFPKTCRYLARTDFVDKTDTIHALPLRGPHKE